MSLRTAHVVALTSLAAFTALVGCRKPAIDSNAAPPDPVVSVQTAPVVEQPMPRSILLTGTLTANRSSDIAANTSGVVSVQPEERGALVLKNDTIAKVDARTAALSATEARVAAANAKLSAQIAKEDCERIEKLYAASAVTAAEYNRQHAICVAASGSVDTSEARLATATKFLGDTTVRAPFAGVVEERFVSVGEYVLPSSKVARIVEITPLRLELSVTEARSAEVSEGQTVEFTVAAQPGTAFTGTLKYVAPALRRETRDLVVEAIVANEDKKLRPGMFATARVILGDRTAVVVPKNAIRADGVLRRIWVVKDGRAQERLIKAGAERGDLVVVENGATAGEQVVTNPPPELRDGSRVK